MAYQVTSKSTQSGSKTPHGFGVPHKYPQSDPTFEDVFISLTKSLYPTGRAWQMPEFSVFESFHIAINKSYLRLVNDARLIIDSSIPDNGYFSEEDANLWEYRLGLITSSTVNLDLRKLAILRKLAFPSNLKARQHPFYIQAQLQAAGFNVYIHENTVPYRTPDEVAASSLTNLQHGIPTQHGPSTQHGSGSYKVIANSIDPNEVYAVGGDSNLYATFFIAGVNIEDQAIVPQSREREFRELVLKLKPAQTVAFLLINFT